MRYYGPINPKPLGVRMPRHIHPMSSRPGLSYGGPDSVESGHTSHLGSAPFTREYDPVFAQYNHPDPSYEQPAPWFEDAHPRPSTPEFALGRPSTPPLSEPEFVPEYEDSLLAPAMATAILDALRGQGEVPEGIDILQFGPVEAALAWDIAPQPGATPLEELVQNDLLHGNDSPIGATLLEALADQPIAPEEIDPTSVGVPPQEDPLDALLAMQHELMMNPQMGYGLPPGPMPGAMPGP